MKTDASTCNAAWRAVSGHAACLVARHATGIDFQGRALPSIESYRNPVAACESYDPYDVPCVIGG
jgi:hypothetical protein